MIEKIKEFRSKFQKEVGCTPQSDMVAYIAWLEVALYESEKNNAKPHVIGRSEQLFCINCKHFETCKIQHNTLQTCRLYNSAK